ncbi:hypothetical protein D6D19_07233 [Aureobasidium pullulans]|uniref:Uncharacterized protein n=1 Tax=Aureobasidium pullulans TaxID=5580 RepID=A0A4S8ZYM0_AURPU|nr:hypothetical protein D6D19_07233 [Aureobasidium pullulans]
MAVPRDPDFWKRFSYAVHQDEEAQVNEKYAPILCPSLPYQSLTLTFSPPLFLPPPQPQLTPLPYRSKSTWLHTTRRKKRHSYIRTCLTFWILLLAIITIFVVVIVILVKTGVLKKIHIGGEKGEQGKKASGDFGDWLSGVFGGGGKGDGDDGKSG